MYGPIRRHESALIVVDVQERLVPAMDRPEALVRNATILVEAAKLLGVPILVSEQYPKGLGNTVPALAEALGDAPRFEKLSFSCGGCESFMGALDDLGRSQVVVCGIEAHVCMVQTVFDLVRRGLTVHVPHDATSSRDPANMQVALGRMRQGGAVVTATESVCFEWLGAAGTDEFKAIARLVK